MASRNEAYHPSDINDLGVRNALVVSGTNPWLGSIVQAVAKSPAGITLDEIPSRMRPMIAHATGIQTAGDEITPDSIKKDTEVLRDNGVLELTDDKHYRLTPSAKRHLHLIRKSLDRLMPHGEDRASSG